MAVDTNLASLFDRLNLVEDPPPPPPRPWESIPSESGPSLSSASASTPPCPSLSSTSTVSEASLVRLAMNALQGVESALISIEKLSAAFCSDPADRTFHRIPSLWNRSLSTLALGEILRSIGCCGCVVFLLQIFVKYYTDINLNTNMKGKKQANSISEDDHIDHEEGRGDYAPYSLVNQAFAVSVGKVLDGYLSALDTLYVSVGLRRASRTNELSSRLPSGVGCLGIVGHPEVTLLEIYLHTKGLRTQIESLGNICNLHDIACCFPELSSEELRAKANLEFNNFPRGGNLLTYLYSQVKAAGTVHCAVLKFLFLRSCEPYFGFIRSWIYKANISDPYEEFIVDYANNQQPCALGNAGISIDLPSGTIKKRDRVAVPCFLKDYLVPLFRAGQQLQVIMKVLELCKNVGTWNHTFEDILPCWDGMSTVSQYYASPLAFDKESIQTIVLSRYDYYERMLEKLNNLPIKLFFRHPQVAPPGAVLINRRPNNLTFFTRVGSSISPSTNESNNKLSVGALDSEASGLSDEFSYVEDPFDSSDCSSLGSSEEQNESEKLVEPPHGIIAQEHKYLSALNFSVSTSSDNAVQKLFQNEMSSFAERSSYERCSRSKAMTHFVNFCTEGMTLSNSSVSLESGGMNLSKIPGAKNTDVQCDLGQLPGGLSDAFHLNIEKVDYSCVYKSDFGLKMSNKHLTFLEESPSNHGNEIPKDTSAGDSMIENPHHISASTSFNLSQLEQHSNFFSKNPMLTRHNFVFLNEPGERYHSDYRDLSPFDFTSVQDPSKVCVEKLSLNPTHIWEAEISTASSFTALADNGLKEGCTSDEVNKRKTANNYFPVESKACSKKHKVLSDVAGGRGWESLLCHFHGTEKIAAKDQQINLMARMEIPLDFVLQKCLLEEILLHYVSRLTIRLLEQGFELQEHLLALRRYHFMELADWADLFIMSLRSHKWCVAEPDRKISEVQGLLEFSVQRFSYERDHNKDRLYVYLKGHGVLPLSMAYTGIHSCDYIGLGYRVDWPINIILTPAALKTYADIFNFLIQDLMHTVDQNHSTNPHGSDVQLFPMLVKLRHQVNHFVSTLQQYVHSQLSYVSWTRLLHSLKHKAKDMMDLELVHMAYLRDSLSICFLSDETQSITTIIRSILQCAVDFRSCLIGSSQVSGVGKEGSLNRLLSINVSEVLSVKRTFEKNINELYICYRKAPRHVEFGLSHFWDVLNYNEYYSEVIGKEMSHCSFLA